ncbi:MAG TPA: dihydroorotase [Aquabacterium sp.]|jgi:dihydroorotase|uniref:dihydroorotase n=1 Tax=Aquabacterium sp. TaxID=1872578 RepID=UPI002E2EC203|nr:dihydroorotase [Aquabacterium sp.]HEX5374428.1 dihydroorotase [Aquabacterium sp.]
MKILIKNGRVVDPASGLDVVGDLAIATGRIVSIGQVNTDFTPDRTIDASGCIVAPGLVDLAVRLREPGHEHEGMLESELAAAAAGGVTSVVCLPDTDPTLDEPGLVEMLKLRARKLSRCRLFPLGALTRGLKGETLTEMAELHEAGCVGYSQAEVPVRDTQVLQRAMQYASTFGYTVWLRPQDAWLGKGIAASGAVATRLGLSGVPVSAETIALHTIVELARATGARVHLCRLSSAAGVDIVRQAKAQGLAITADVSINSLMLTDVDIGYFNSAMRVVPPLRQGRDRDALQAALRDGTLDALVSDHTPVSEDEKLLPFGEATPGATGVELLLSLALKAAGLQAGTAASLDAQGLRHALATVTQGPVKVLGEAIGSLSSSAGRLVQGGVADVCVFDPQVSWRVEPAALVSQGKHTPFAYDCTGFELPGRVRTTLVAGQLAHDGEQA